MVKVHAQTRAKMVVIKSQTHVITICLFPFMVFSDAMSISFDHICLNSVTIIDQ